MSVPLVFRQKRNELFWFPSPWELFIPPFFFSAQLGSSPSISIPSSAPHPCFSQEHEPTSPGIRPPVLPSQQLPLSFVALSPPCCSFLLHPTIPPVERMLNGSCLFKKRPSRDRLSLCISLWLPYFLPLLFPSLPPTLPASCT